MADMLESVCRVCIVSSSVASGLLMCIAGAM